MIHERLVVIWAALAAILLTFGAGCLSEEFQCPKPRNASRAPAGSVPKVDRVFMVVLENTDMEAALAQPFFNELTKSGALLTDFHGVARPSQPNYIALTAGSTLDVDSNSEYSLKDRHLGDLLEEKGKSWKTYAEGYPGGCYLEPYRGAYSRKHVPFLSYKNVQESPERCARVLPATELSDDVADGELADFSLYIPDNNNNGHDTGVEHSDRWLKATFGSLLSTKKFMEGTLFVVTFDEASHEDDSNRILTVLKGDMVTPGSASGSCYTHYDLLRTVEEALGLEHLGRKDTAGLSISGIWAH